MTASAERAKKAMCDACHWKGMYTEVLMAPSPFDSADTITGCPHCKAVEAMRIVCDEPGCWNRQTCGCDAPGGYRMTCSKHMPP